MWSLAIRPVRLVQMCVTHWCTKVYFPTEYFPTSPPHLPSPPSPQGPSPPLPRPGDRSAASEDDRRYERDGGGGGRDDGHILPPLQRGLRQLPRRAGGGLHPQAARLPRLPHHHCLQVRQHRLGNWSGQDIHHKPGL